MITRTESDVSSNLLFMANSIKDRTKLQKECKIKQKVQPSSAVLHFINCSILADQFTFNSQGSESISECTHIKQYCKNISFQWQQAINQCDKASVQECFGQGHSKPLMSCTVTWHFKHLKKKMISSIPPPFKILVETNKKYLFVFL